MDIIEALRGCDRIQHVAVSKYLKDFSSGCSTSGSKSHLNLSEQSCQMHSFICHSHTLYWLFLNDCVCKVHIRSYFPFMLCKILKIVNTWEGKIILGGLGKGGGDIIRNAIAEGKKGRL